MADHEFSQHKSDTGTFPEQNNPDTVTSPEADQSAVCAITAPTGGRDYFV